MLSCRIHKRALFLSTPHRANTTRTRSLLFVVLAISIPMVFPFPLHTFSLRRSILARKHEALIGGACRASVGSGRLFGAAAGGSSNINTDSKKDMPPVSLYRSEGIFCVNKPLDWTSNDVVSYIRGMLERDARERGAKPVKVTSRRNKSRILRVGHGGTLDPLATGVLVIGVGKGTKELQR